MIVLHQNMPKQVGCSFNIPLMYVYTIQNPDLRSVSVFLVPAVAFKNARQLELAKDAYLQEAEAHTNNRSYPSDLCVVLSI